MRFQEDDAEMKVIVITAENFLERETDALHLLFENGLKVLHLRKPRASQNEMKAFIEQLKAEFYPRIVLHDYYDLTELFDLKGIHLNCRNQEAFFKKIDADGIVGLPSGRPVSESNNAIENDCFFLKGRLSTSRSCHSLEEVAESRFFDYLFLSPVFDSISKAGYKQGFMPEQLAEAKKKKIIDEKVIALGGITAENLPLVRNYGFGGIAVLGALWSGFERNNDMNELLKRFNELKIICEDQ
ncbi:MAG: thiamine phosphate synthase [Tannerella sp.]|jgi:thiamine-phosphate pyrophosphorylase|nr:thiamine phosphate synthase [Tannerella sp.]